MRLIVLYSMPQRPHRGGVGAIEHGCGNDVVQGGSEHAPATDVKDLLRTRDWAATPLGPVADWPQSLRTAVDLMIASGYAMCLAWGPDRTFLYNQAYARILGRRHPRVFGAPFVDVWPEVWSEIEPLVDRTFAGETSTFDDMPLMMTRNGYPEETWWSFSYSPVRDETGAVAGLLNVTLETTSRVLVERERDAATRDLRDSEAKWRSVFETLQEGFVLGELVRDEHGHVVDWRYDEVNDAWYDLMGVPRGQAVGRTIRQVFPGIEEAWVREMAQVVERDRSVRFTRQLGSSGRWYDGVTQRAGGDRFTVIFTEVTERVLRERRQAALIDLNDRLHEETTVAAIASAASAILAAALHADCGGYGEVDAVAGTVTIAQEWAAGDEVSLAGTWPIADFATSVEELAEGRLLARADAPLRGRVRQACGEGAMVLVPIIERGVPAAILYLGTHRPRAWTREELHFVGEVADRLRLAIGRTRAEEQQEVLNGELAHRIKNTLSVVQAIAMQTLAGKADATSVEEFGSRLKALSSAHDVLLTRSWSAAGLREVAQGALSTVAGNRVTLSGPELMIGSRPAMSLSLLLHELATNAVKYGALRVPEGEVELAWAIACESGVEMLTLRWTERGGPSVTPPTRTGFGSRIIRMGLTGSGGVQVRYDTSGLSVEMRAPIDQIGQG